jgi:hypothetical protein
MPNSQKWLIKKVNKKSGIVAHACNLSTQKAEAGED